MIRLGRPWFDNSANGRLAEAISYARRNGGATLYASDGSVAMPDMGYAVSAHGFEHRVSDDEGGGLASALAAYIEKTSGLPGVHDYPYIGLWFDGDTLVLDRSRVVPGYRIAAGLALQNDQQAFYDFDNARVVDTFYALATILDNDRII